MSRDRTYGQFCGLARAAEVLGQRWTLLVLRDLLVGPRRYSDLVEGLPGIPTAGLARRLRELEDDGLVVREVSARPDRSIVYRATERALELIPAFDALARWGAADMHEPKPGEVVTTASLVGALRSGVQPDAAAAGDTSRTITYEVQVGDAVAHAVVDRAMVTVAPGGSADADLRIEAGPGFRDVLAGELDLATAVRRGDVRVRGDRTLFEAFQRTFRVPYTTASTRRDHP